MFVWLFYLEHQTMTPRHRLDEALRWIGFNWFTQRKGATTSLRGCLANLSKGVASFFDLIAACEEHSTESQTRSRSAVELLHIIDSKKRSHLSWKGRQTIQSKRVASSFDLVAACVERSTEAEHVENAWEVCSKSTLCKLFDPLCCYRSSNQGPGSWSR